MFDFDNNDNEGDSFCFGLLSSQDDDTNLFEFPPLADIPLESKDDALDVLKKRPHSPDVGASIKKPAKSSTPAEATAKDARKVSTDLKAAAVVVKHCNASVGAAKASDDERAFELKTDNTVCPTRKVLLKTLHPLDPLAIHQTSLTWSTMTSRSYLITTTCLFVTLSSFTPPSLI
eukprot:scaffold109890_cov70-Cyclotella_meneghiniana.AAC.2